MIDQNLRHLQAQEDNLFENAQATMDKLTTHLKANHKPNGKMMDQFPQAHTERDEAKEEKRQLEENLASQLATTGKLHT